MTALLVWTVLQVIGGQMFTVQYEFEFKTYRECMAVLDVIIAEHPNADAECVEQA